MVTSSSVAATSVATPPTPPMEPPPPPPGTVMSGLYFSNGDSYSDVRRRIFENSGLGQRPCDSQQL